MRIGPGSLIVTKYTLIFVNYCFENVKLLYHFTFFFLFGKLHFLIRIETNINSKQKINYPAPDYLSG